MCEVMAKRKYNHEAAIEYLKINGPSLSREIGENVFGFKRRAAARAHQIMVLLERKKLVFRAGKINDCQVWSINREDMVSKDRPIDDLDDPIEYESLFNKDFQPQHKPCYQGPRGFVHVYNPGEYTCNCGERTCETMKGKYVGNSFLYSNMK
jgi:hypothetical protein